MVLYLIHREVDAVFIAVMRIGFLVTVIAVWSRVVDGLIVAKFVHPLRRSAVLAFRWRFAALVAILELFVIQQLPQLIVGAIKG